MLFSVLVGLPAVAAGCGSGDTSTDPAGYAGFYYSAKNDGSFIELKADGSFRLKEEGLNLTGKFQVKNGSLTLTAYAEFQKPPVNGRIRDGRITDPSGLVWTRQAHPPAQTAPATATTGTASRKPVKP